MIDRSNWQWFRVGDLFPPQKCKCSNATELLEDGDEIAYIGAKKSDNGVMRYVKRVESLVSRGNCIVFIGDGQGSVGYCIYQPVDFIGSTTLIAGYNMHLNPYNAAFLISVLDQERFRYSFGRKYKKEVIANSKIQLPAIMLNNGEYEPDWQYMEDFIKDSILPQLPKKAQKVWLQKYDAKPQKNETMKLNTAEWKWFAIEDFCDYPYKAKAYNANELIECASNTTNAILYVTRTDVNNGCKGFVINEGFENIEIGNAITIGDTTSTIFYQERNFICGDHMVVLRSKHFNTFTGLFITALLNRERFRYNYGRAFTMDIIANTRIKLPVTPTGEPDWQFMEDYIKSLPYSKNLEPSDPNEVVDELVEMKKEMIKMRRALEAQQNERPMTVNIYENGSNYYDQSRHITLK